MQNRKPIALSALSADFISELQSTKRFSGELRYDLTSRLLYSTDASIYQIEPLGVAFPRSTEDLITLIETSAKYEIPILARGSGSSLAGQAIGRALVIDCSRYLNRLIEVNREEQTATVEPGMILNTLNRAVSPYQLQFGPDPASAERATIGGCIANNAAGAHSIIYGMTADHIISLDIILSDGSTATFSEISLLSAQKIAAESNSITARLYRKALDLRSDYSEEIQKQWPETWRRASGYNLNYLLPWSPSQPPQWSSNQEWFSGNLKRLPYPPVLPGQINLAPLIAGSEGTLAVIHKAKLRLVSKPRCTILGVLSFGSIIEACEAVQEILLHEPSAVELIPQSLIKLARSVPAYAPLTSFVENIKVDEQDPAALLVVEFSGNEPAILLEKMRRLDKHIWIAESAEVQKRVWDVRKVGLGILMSRPGDHKPVAFIEDTAVPVNRLGEFVREIEKILDQYGTTADFYAHASAGCLHIRPLLNLKTIQGVTNLRAIAEQTVDLTLRLGGAVSAEHGDGLARGEWLEKTYGKIIVQAFHDLKFSADPKGLLNPGKIVDPLEMDKNLRFGETYRSVGWQPVFQFSNAEERQRERGLVEAIEQCNGAGVCRKSDGVMCPSFQASQEEMHSTRGRANLLRALISGNFPTRDFGLQAVREALDLCLACKGCKSECPSGVDIARLKYEFFNYYYSEPKHKRHVRDYLFGYIGNLAAIGHPFAPIVNSLLETNTIKKTGERLIGLSSQRAFPKMSTRSLHSQWKKRLQHNRPELYKEDVLFLSDAFTEYFQPHIGLTALDVLSKIGCRIHILPTQGAGRTLISKGFLESAKKHGKRLLSDIQRLDPDGMMPIVGVEPSEIYTLRDEFLDLFSDDPKMLNISSRAFMLDEYLIRPGTDGDIRYSKLTFKDSGGFNQKVLFHGHCYQKAQSPAEDGFPMGVAASLVLLKAAGYSVQLIDAGCCGMAGAFGYEKEHFDFSMQVAEQTLLPTIRRAVQANSSVILCTPGVSCHAQIEDGTDVTPFHPIQLIAKKL